MFYEKEKGIEFYFQNGHKAVFFFREFYPDSNILFPVQKHTRNIMIFPYESFQECDGVITHIENKINLGVKTADCLPVIFISDKVKGVIHAGWRGIVKGIFDELEIKLKKLGESIENLTFVIGPHICRRCYEVKEDVMSIFENFCKENGTDMEKVIHTADGKIFIDLFSCVREILLSKGAQKIFHSGICVREDERFFSRRRGDMKSQPSCLICEVGG